MRFLALLACALWAIGCSAEADDPPPFRAARSASANEPAKPSGAAATSVSAAGDDVAPPVEDSTPMIPNDDPLSPTLPKQLFEHIVKPSAADPSVKQVDEEHYIYLDTRADPKPQLVLYLTGATVLPSKAVPMLKDIASYGFHVVGLRYMNDFVVQDLCNGKPVESNCQGALRREVIQGMDTSQYVTVAPQDSIDTRLSKILAYLEQQAPGEGWGEYLSGTTPMWSNIIVAGHSSGASTAARMSKLRGLAGVMMLSGPNDNSAGVPSKWMSETQTTPVSRIWAFSDTDDAQFPEHQRGWDVLGLAGTATSVDSAVPPYGGSHRLTTSVPGGGHPTPQIGGGAFTGAWRTGLGLNP